LVLPAFIRTTLRSLRKRSARCEKCFTPRRNEPATFATPLNNRAGRVSKITWCHYHFPEVKNSEIVQFISYTKGGIRFEEYS
jgi:hypothetical protein